MPNVSFLEFMNQADPDVQGIVQIITNESIFMRRLRFITLGTGVFSYEYARQQTTGGIAFRGFNEIFTPDIGVVNPAIEGTRIFGGAVNTDHLLCEGAKGSAVRANNIANKVKRAGLTFDKTVIDGNVAANPKEFDGLNRRLTGNQVITAGDDGAVLTLELVDAILDQTIGSDDQKFLLCNKAARRQLKNLIIDAAGGAAVADVNAPVASYRGAAIEVMDEDGDNTVILDFDETVGGSNVTASMYCINPSGTMDQENMRGLVTEAPSGDLIRQLIAPGMVSGFFNDIVEGVMGLALHHPRCATRLKGILRG